MVNKSTEIIWQPDPADIAASQMQQFLQQSAERYDRSFTDYASLHEWSVNEPEEFWAAVADFSGIEFSVAPGSILEQPGDMLTARWFDGAQFNFAAELLKGEPGQLALVFRDERGRRREITRAELCRSVANLAAAMRQSGVGQGDRVAAMLPNCPEAVVVMLAAASIGAVFSSCSPDFGLQAILERFGQIQPRLLFVCDGYSYGGKPVDCLKKAAALIEALPELSRCVVVPFLDEKPELNGLTPAIHFNDYLIAESEPEFTQLPFNHPLYILYSSGTTGKPKCIVHGAGGTLLQHKKELMLHTNLSPEERVFYFTTCGWMMWNWLVSALSTGSTVVLYDGSPAYPVPDALIRMCSEEAVNVFGTSPRYLSMLEKDTDQAVTGWPELRTVLSTGAPLSPESYDFVSDTLGEHVQLCSISGGTDLISCFALGNPMLPVYRGELQAPGLGMAVAVFDQAGRSLLQAPGELVCTRAFPSMPLGFWNDAEGRYESSYFATYPGVWAHGDMAEITVHGGLKIHGRSDAVLNPGGVRIGSAEVCAPAMTVDGVIEVVAVAQVESGEEQILLFAVLREGLALTDKLQEQIRAAIRNQSSPRHVPARILQVPDIPRTLNGKVVELAVKAVINGQPVENRDVLANPESLEYFRDCL